MKKVIFILFALIISCNENVKTLYRVKVLKIVDMNEGLFFIYLQNLNNEKLIYRIESIDREDIPNMGTKIEENDILDILLEKNKIVKFHYKTRGVEEIKKYNYDVQFTQSFKLNLKYYSNCIDGLYLNKNCLLIE